MLEVFFRLNDTFLIFILSTIAVSFVFLRICAENKCNFCLSLLDVHFYGIISVHFLHPFSLKAFPVKFGLMQHWKKNVFVLTWHSYIPLSLYPAFLKMRIQSWDFAAWNIWNRLSLVYTVCPFVSIWKSDFRINDICKKIVKDY